MPPVSEHILSQYGMREGAEQFPLMVVLAVSYRCNAACPHCPYTNSSIRSDYSDATFLNEGLYRSIADQCGEHNAYLRITGGGEPYWLWVMAGK